MEEERFLEKIPRTSRGSNFMATTLLKTAPSYFLEKVLSVRTGQCHHKFEIGDT